MTFYAISIAGRSFDPFPAPFEVAVEMAFNDLERVETDIEPGCKRFQPITITVLKKERTGKT